MWFNWSCCHLFYGFSKIEAGGGPETKHFIGVALIAAPWCRWAMCYEQHVTPLLQIIIVYVHHIAVQHDLIVHVQLPHKHAVYTYTQRSLWLIASTYATTVSLTVTPSTLGHFLYKKILIQDTKPLKHRSRGLKYWCVVFLSIPKLLSHLI